jgi:hypothetical protein
MRLDGPPGLLAHTMVTASVDKTARIWDAEAGAQIAVLLGPLCPIFKGFLRLPTFIPAKPCPSLTVRCQFRCQFSPPENLCHT